MKKEESFHKVQRIAKYSGSLFVVIPRTICTVLDINHGDLMKVELNEKENKVVYEKIPESEINESILLKVVKGPSKKKERRKEGRNVTQDYEAFLESLEQDRQTDREKNNKINENRYRNHLLQ